MNRIVPIDCKRKKNELTCPIERAKFENNIGSDNIIYVVIFDKYGNDRMLDFIPEIRVDFDIMKMNVIYVEITRLLTDYTWINNYIVYETNVTDIQNIFINDIELTFGDFYLSCKFIKGENHPMLVACLLEELKEDTYPENLSLNEIKREIIFDESSVIYEFRIQPVKIDKKCNFVSDYLYSEIVGNYPEVLDFKSKESCEIEIYMQNPEYIDGLTFNEEKEDLQCSNIGNLKRCIVEKSHFEGKESGYYYIKYNGYNSTKTIAYEVQPIKVILTGSDDDNDSDKSLLAILLGIIGTIVVIIILIVIIYFFYFKKRKSNLEEKVINASFNDDRNDE